MLVLTQWAEFGDLDLHGIADAMRGGIVFDGRNVVDEHHARRAGLRHMQLGAAD